VAKEWALLIQEQIALLGIARATGKRRLTVERHGSRRLDDGNLVGGLKQIIDEIVKFGLLVDDDGKHLSLVAEQVDLEKNQKPFTTFTLQDI
jgi:hypothetical protein